MRDVVPQKLEAAVIEQMSDVAARPGEEIVDAEHLVILGKQPLAQM